MPGLGFHQTILYTPNWRTTYEPSLVTPTKGETTHYILRVASASSSSAVTDSLDFQVADAPLQIQFASAKCVRCASLRSEGRRLAVRTAMEHPINALLRTPFPASRDFAPVGSMSLDSRVAGLPYESSSLAHPSPLRGPLPLKGTQEHYGIYLFASYVMKSITVISHLRWLSPLWCLTAPPSPHCVVGQ